MPAISKLAQSNTVIAPDMPGQGLSSPFQNGPTLDKFVGALHEIVNVLNLESFHLAGHGAGAALALAYTARHRHRVAGLDLRDVPAATDPERTYPKLEPSSDGSHLATIWNLVRSRYVFHPWYETSVAHRLVSAVPGPRQLHTEVMAILNSADYGCLGRAVSDHDWQAEARHYSELTSSPSTPVVPSTEIAIPLPPSEKGTISRFYCNTSQGQIHFRESGHRSGRPLLMIHESPGSARLLESHILEFGLKRWVLAPDTLGNGLSDDPQRPDANIEFYSDILTEALDLLRIPEVDVFGSHTGALIGMELAIKQPRRCRNLVMEGITLFPAEEAAEYASPRYLRPIEPDEFGCYLLQAWGMQRDMQLFWPWYNRTPQGARNLELEAVGGLHTRVVDFLNSGSTYPISYRAAYLYPAAERIRSLGVRTLLCAYVNDVLRPFVEQAAGINPHVATKVLRQREDLTAVCETFFDGQA